MSATVGKSLRHESAPLHVSGRATYIDDMTEPAGCLHAAFGLSTCAHGRILSMDLAAVKASPGVVAVLSAEDIPGINDCGPTPALDDPTLAQGMVHFHGQPVFLVIATSHDAARRAARRGQIEYDALPAITDIPSAIAAASWVLPPVAVSRGDALAALEAAPHRLQGRADLGGQEHFYLESQVAMALPREGASMHVLCSTQHPTEMQHAVAHTLGWASHQVSVECRRMGGGFGGKESQSAQVACAVALAAWKTGRAVKMRLDRDDDMMITGKRHDFAFEWDAGFDDAGRLCGLAIRMASRCGFSVDLSGPVNDRAIFHLDNCYYLDAVTIHSLRCRTNTVSNTAFRGFGGPQGIFAIEYILDDIARKLGRDPLDVRRANFYGQTGDARSTTHYGMAVEDNIAPQLVDALASDCDYAARREAIAAFNAANPVLKRGIALTPVKFGISFTATFFNQAGAQVNVYADGSVLVTHGGTEMGQGLYTKIAQIVAHEFGLPLDKVRLLATDTSRVPNTSATAASSGADLNGKAAQDAARKISARLTAFFRSRHNLADDVPVRFADGKLQAGEASEEFATLVALAYKTRIQLWDAGFYATPKIHYDASSLQGRPFFYFAYGACCTEVVIDTLTGEYRVLRADILHDAGRSLNPAIDIGQIEGGFIQGMGWLTREELVFDNGGRLRTHAPSTYKIPAASDCPPVMNVKLWQGDNVEDSIHRSKAVGEPPLVHGVAVFLALRDACSAALGRAAPLQAPATPEAVLRAIGGIPAPAPAPADEAAEGLPA